VRLGSTTTLSMAGSPSARIVGSAPLEVCSFTHVYLLATPRTALILALPQPNKMFRCRLIRNRRAVRGLHKVSTLVCAPSRTDRSVCCAEHATGQAPASNGARQNSASIPSGSNPQGHEFALLCQITHHDFLGYRSDECRHWCPFRARPSRSQL
jgi:hypothetical protein